MGERRNENERGGGNGSGNFKVSSLSQRMKNAREDCKDEFR